MTKSNKRARRFWVGVGLGWSAFMFAKLLYNSHKTKYITTKS